MAVDSPPLVLLVESTCERETISLLTGMAGVGKTTLAKMLVNELSPTEGEVRLGHNVQLGYYAQNQSDSLHPKLTLLETMENAAVSAGAAPSTVVTSTLQGQPLSQRGLTWSRILLHPS